MRFLPPSLVLATTGLFIACAPAPGDGDKNNGSGSGNGADSGIDIDVGNGSGGNLNLPGNGNGNNTSGTGGIPEDCDATLELVLRDFNSSHEDMQNFNGGSNDVGCGIVADLLDTSDGKRQPTFQTGSGTARRGVEKNRITCTPWDQYYTGNPEVTSAATFSQWYNDVEGVNMTVEYAVELQPQDGSDNYVFDSANTPPGFFPLDGKGFDEITEGHNFHFTTEAHVRFTYLEGQEFTFSGDDDLWIFVNNRLALDLGGLHGPISATIFFDEIAQSHGLSHGSSYNMDIFHAERHTSASNFRVETNIGCF